MTTPHRIFAACYDHLNRPWENGWLGAQRTELLGELTGTVLDVGAGTGANLPHYRNAERVLLAEPDAAMRSRLIDKLHLASVEVEVDDSPAERLPYADGSCDAVVFTLVLCTVSDPDRALAEARRVLVPDGRLIVLEHVRGSARLARWQDRLTPVWSRVAAGCHPNRDTATAIGRAGFRLTPLSSPVPLPRWIPDSAVLRAIGTPT